MHEIGHVLGFDDTTGSTADLMCATLKPGVRLLSDHHIDASAKGEHIGLLAYELFERAPLERLFKNRNVSHISLLSNSDVSRLRRFEPLYRVFTAGRRGQKQDTMRDYLRRHTNGSLLARIFMVFGE